MKANFKEDFKRRVSENTTSRWIRFGFVSIVFFAWVAWLGNWWVALWWLLLFDIYITGYIPFPWWKKSKSATTRTVMSWVDAIVYAIVLVYFVFSFVGQNYQIPSSSLEKTLLTGDYLWVNKTAYGPRVPMTPIHFPLVQNTLPGGAKSYLENPQWKYHRLKGTDTIALGDIVVFNFPGGDTVALKEQNPDIYSLSRMIGEQLAAQGMPINTSGRIERDASARALGMQYIRSNPQVFGEVIWRPVDRRENYVKRTVGLPGQLFEIKNGEIYNNGQKMNMPEDAQFVYDIRFKNPAKADEILKELGVSEADRALEPGMTHPTPPLTAKMVEELRKNPEVIEIRRRTYSAGDNLLFPLASAVNDGWTLDNYGPIRIPERGMTVELNDSTWAQYGHTISHYENPTAEWRDGKAYINGEPVTEYTFNMDYYFMMGDNRHKSADSQFWGYMPESHIVCRPVRVMISFDPDKSFPFNIRWNRILKKASN